MVHPARYEAYGLGVHEAICRGLPAIVSAGAGIAELYPADASGSSDRRCRRRARHRRPAASLAIERAVPRPNGSCPLAERLRGAVMERHGRGDRAGGDRMSTALEYRHSTRATRVRSAAARNWTRYTSCMFELSIYTTQDPELAAYTGQHARAAAMRRLRIRASRRRCPSLPRFFDRLYDQRWSDEWIAANSRPNTRTSSSAGFSHTLGGGCVLASPAPRRRRPRRDDSLPARKQRAGPPKGSSSIRRPPRMPRGGRGASIRQLNVHEVDERHRGVRRDHA